MYTKIIIEDAERTIEAHRWLAKNKPSGRWSFDSYNVMSDDPKYIFSFENDFDATFFALKWR
jgi:hypothetical protein